MAFVNPTEIVQQFGLQPDMVAADFGTGSGAYAIEMAKLVRPNGKVYALDVQKELLVRLKNHLPTVGVTNVELLWADFENIGGSKIGDRLVDFVLVSNVLFQAPSKYNIALEAKRVLKPDGRVAVIDWTESFGGMGPHPDEVVTEAKARQIFEQAGFQVEGSFQAGDHHYGVIFKKG